MKKDPRISVILPVYNCEKFIHDCLHSILNQSFSDFEVLIIDDASTDKTLDIIESFNDPRVQLIKKEKNSGYLDSLNMALAIAKGDYIARMDSDDISELSRFEKQIRVLDNQASIGLCTCDIRLFGNENSVVKKPTSSRELKATLFFRNLVGHPMVMIRRAILDEYNFRYESEFYKSEDFRLWTRLALVTDFASISEPLLRYRVHGASITANNVEIQNRLSIKIISDFIYSKYRLKVPEKFCFMLFRPYSHTEHPKVNVSDLLQTFFVLNDLLEADNDIDSSYVKKRMRRNLKNSSYYNANVSLFGFVRIIFLVKSDLSTSFFFKGIARKILKYQSRK